MHKYSWKYLTEHIKNGKTIITFDRYSDYTQKYDAHREKLTKRYEKLSDYIKIKYMNWKKIKKEDAFKIYAVKKSRNSLSYVIIENIFPYNIESNIGHYVLFSENELQSNDINTKINNFIHEKFKKEKQYLWFVNSKENQSIDDLWHCHIFIKF